MAKIEKYKKVIFDNGKTLFINYAEPIGHSDKILRVSKDGKRWAVVNAETGEFISDYQHKYVKPIVRYDQQSDKLIKVSEDGKVWAAVNANTGEFVSDYCYSDIYTLKNSNKEDSMEEFFGVTDLNGKYGVIKEDGIETIFCEYYRFYILGENLLLCTKYDEDIFGIKRFSGEEIAPMEYLRRQLVIMNMPNEDGILKEQKGVFLWDKYGNLEIYDSKGKRLSTNEVEVLFQFNTDLKNLI